MEQAVGMSSVAQIFKERSEAFFRDSEVILLLRSLEDVIMKEMCCSGITSCSSY